MIQGPARDPVCGTVVEPTSAKLICTYKGNAYYFCDETCQSAFTKDPEKYLKKRGLVLRFIDRLAEANRKAYGPGGPSCCN